MNYGQIVVLFATVGAASVIASLVGDMSGAVSHRWFDRLLLLGTCCLLVVIVMLFVALCVSVGNT